ncbi:carbon-nitrogen hydrolase family protein [Parathalassolituus penaei]|uniref:Carbon-nitrogen hydrolase family protein n=1 Tax=Parathalassolituus penaei TaxID=2997323 RepID=A0A9X3ITF5_9GAMM|nr:carbon-nitrogen hydrolase family protein [Parathalassolituus penaei]MCY0967432.1 carbon-nitrogen hydrolase family protein [Parathalassolituus penaei]
MTRITVAAAQYPISFFGHWREYHDKLDHEVRSAARLGARLLVFPEYASLELASLLGEAVYRDLHQQLVAVQELWPEVLELHQELARRYDVMILGASFPVLEDGHFYNRAVLYSPDGVLGWQDKMIMTRFETEQWGISAGRELRVIPTDIGPLAVNICYDSEFPLLARQQVEAGARLILVPSCTDTEAGFNRVKIGCQARALENQCYVVQAPTFGTALWSPALDENTGVASIYTPVDYGFPDNGILASGDSQQPGWVMAELDLDALETVRQQGQVYNHRDWSRQLSIRL